MVSRRLQGFLHHINRSQIEAQIRSNIRQEVDAECQIQEADWTHSSADETGSKHWYREGASEFLDPVAFSTYASRPVLPRSLPSHRIMAGRPTSSLTQLSQLITPRHTSAHALRKAAPNREKSPRSVAEPRPMKTIEPAGEATPRVGARSIGTAWLDRPRQSVSR